jgi:hypothetical protein
MLDRIEGHTKDREAQQGQGGKAFEFSIFPVYSLHEGATELDLRSHMENRFAQALGLLSALNYASTQGDASDQNIANAIWGVEQMVRECQELAEVILARRVATAT